MESNRRNSLFMMVTVLLLWPCVAQANAGTPLIWGEFLHLTGGNVLIGLVEGILLYKLFKLEIALQAVQIGEERKMHRGNGFSQFLFRLDWFLGVANIQRVCHSMDD